MCYSIILSKSAKKFYDKANEKIKRNLERTFLTLSPEVDEKVKNVDKKRDQSNTYRRRLGHYRIVYQKQGDVLLITSPSGKTMKVKIVKILLVASIKDASSMYEVM